LLLSPVLSLGGHIGSTLGTEDDIGRRRQERKHFAEFIADHFEDLSLGHPGLEPDGGVAASAAVDVELLRWPRRSKNHRQLG